jgi:ribosomal protein S27AE
MKQNSKNVNTLVDTLNNSLLSQSFISLSHVCVRCGSHQFREILEPVNSPHHARIVCGECEKFKAWQKDPAISEAYHERIILIDKLLATHKTNSWETNFLKDIRQPRVLTGRQPVKLSQICKRLLPDISAKPGEYDEIVDWLWGDAP